jgi:hypothetical protein
VFQVARSKWQRKGLVISLGEEQLFLRKVGWTLHHWNDPRIPRRLRNLEEHGFASQFDKIWEYGMNFNIDDDHPSESERNKPHVLSNKEEPEGPKALEISGNIVVIFVLFCAGITISSTVFFVELRPRSYFSWKSRLRRLIPRKLIKSRDPNFQLKVNSRSMSKPTKNQVKSLLKC